MDTLLGERSGSAFGDGWVRSSCIVCLNRCGILAHVNDDGVVDKILGDPENPHNGGRTCAKGDSGFEGLRDETRITVPLRRTNPERGIGIDPGWKEISWDEALDEIARHVRETLAVDPQRLMFTSFDTYTLRGAMTPSFVMGAGMPGYSTWSAAIFCGNNVHNLLYMNQNAFESNPDPKYAKYILLIGSQFGSVVHYDTMHAAREIGQRRASKDVHIVAIDPVCGAAASRAEEWVPIRPGTDAALMLGMIDQLVNELDLYDAPFLREFTNAPYLIGDDGHYVRDDDGVRPLVWDETDDSARPFDEAPKTGALTGSYTVRGRSARPAFEALREHVRKYTPEYVEEVTTVPAATVRRLAREFGEAACIGQTIEIDGVELPYRPASVSWYRGLSAHKHSMLNGLAIVLLQTLIGALDVPGGLLADPYSLKGKTPTREYEAPASPEGLISRGFIGGGRVGSAYPPRKVRAPETPEMFELLPVGPYGAIFYLLNSEEPEKYKSPPFPLMMIQHHANMMKTSGPPDVMERFLRRIPFIVSITRRFEETTEMADIVLPDLHYLERLVPFTYQHYGSGDAPISCYGSKPVVAAEFEGPTPDEQYVDVMQIYLEIAKRAGFLPDLYSAFNTITHLKPEYRLDPGGQYSYIEMVERWLRNEFGDDHGLDWYLSDGLWTDEKSVTEKYPRPFVAARAQVYFEFMKAAGDDVRRVTAELGIPWETDDYQVLPDWKPGPAYKHPPPHDLYLVNLKVSHHAQSHTHHNPILRALSVKHNDLRSLWLHPTAAAARGICDGDRVIVESAAGRSQIGTARVTHLVHPDVAAIQGGGGGWARGSNRDELNFNALLNIDAEHIDFLTGALDSIIAVRVAKAEEVAR